MLGLIKKIFSKREKQEEKVELNMLEEWLDSKAKPIFEELGNRINQLIKGISDEKIRLGENLKVLEDAELLNPKIPERAKTIMQGNRASFIKKVSFFLDNIDLKMNGYDEIAGKSERIVNDLDLLAKSTAKSYHILNEFFAREIEKSASCLKGIGDKCRELKDAISKSKAPLIGKIKEAIGSAQSKIKLKEGRIKGLESKNKELNSKESRRSELEHNINRIKSSQEYENYQNLLSEKKHVESKIKDNENSFFHDFSALERALRKYAKIAFEDENMVLAYLENPIKALIDDSGLRIMAILSKLKDAIKKGNLGLEDKKSEKAIALLENLNLGYFTKIKNTHMDLGENLSDALKRLENDETAKKLDALKEQLNDINHSLDFLSGDIKALEDEINKINIPKLKEEMQKDIMDVLSERALIS